MNKVVLVALLAAAFIAFDNYIFQAVKVASDSASDQTSKYIKIGFIGITVLSLFGLIIYNLIPAEIIGDGTRTIIMVGLFIIYVSKLIVLPFLLVDDLRRGVTFLISKIQPNLIAIDSGTGITRSKFIIQLGLGLAAIPFASLIWGVVSGGHDYKVINHKIALKNLPKVFNGLRIAQISDIHSGSFYNKEAVEHGVKMLQDQNADAVFFTGDLVNNKAEEMKNYMDTFGNITAPLGVYSVLGNHDYGDYVQWESPAAKIKNLEDLKATHGNLGWQLLMNEHVMLEREGEKIAILGIENWGARANFPKYGNMQKANSGTEEAKVKLLLSHDPSHWDAEVREKYKDIDIMFAGHTHGMQFGIEIAGIKWSPVKYLYKQWAGLYQKADQYLHVNRGFGFLGYPGRVGILPEITIIELEKA
ncbi:MAG: metallophosphoesterase [Flavobacteriales bacterium]|nr:metallophosphoesterase [Flavobacteriales bacterium]